jgi:hypothetical protein
MHWRRWDGVKLFCRGTRIISLVPLQKSLPTGGMLPVGLRKNLPTSEALLVPLGICRHTGKTILVPLQKHLPIGETLLVCLRKNLYTGMMSLVLLQIRWSLFERNGLTNPRHFSILLQPPGLVQLAIWVVLLCLSQWLLR